MFELFSDLEYVHAAVVKFTCKTWEKSWRRLKEDLSAANFLLDFKQVQKESGREKSTVLFPELTLKELVFLPHKYYSIFLLQQEASAL
jgi:hypothetical protein